MILKFLKRIRKIPASFINALINPEAATVVDQFASKYKRKRKPNGGGDVAAGMNNSRAILKRQK